MRGGGEGGEELEGKITLHECVRKRANKFKKNRYKRFDFFYQKVFQRSMTMVSLAKAGENCFLGLLGGLDAEFFLLDGASYVAVCVLAVCEAGEGRAGTRAKSVFSVRVWNCR